MRLFCVYLHNAIHNTSHVWESGHCSRPVRPCVCMRVCVRACTHTLAILVKTLDQCQGCLRWSSQQLLLSFSLHPSTYAWACICLHAHCRGLRNHRLEAQLSYDFNRSAEQKKKSASPPTSVFVPFVPENLCPLWDYGLQLLLASCSPRSGVSGCTQWWQWARSVLFVLSRNCRLSSLRESIFKCLDVNAVGWVKGEKFANNKRDVKSSYRLFIQEQPQYVKLIETPGRRFPLRLHADSQESWIQWNH